MILDFSNRRRETSHRKVALEWIDDYYPYRVGGQPHVEWCRVCHFDFPIGLMFGRPFLAEKKRRRRRMTRD